MGLAAAGGAIAGLIYHLKKKDTCEEEEFDDEFEDNDFDLDSDLKPVSDREYVSLNPSAREDGEEEEAAKAEEAKDADAADDDLDDDDED